MPRVPVTSSVSKSRGGRISTAPLGMAQQGVARSAATSIIPFMNRDNSMSKIGQGLSAASSVIGGIAADKKNIENSVKDAAEAKAEAASKKMQDEFEQQQREMDAANAWEITKQVYQETRSLRDELIKRQGQQASGVNNDFVSGYQSIMEARLKDQNDNVRKMVEKDNWKSFAKWENETHFYEQQQLELFKKNAFESKMSLSIQQAADNLDNSDLFEDDKLDYQEMLEAKAQEARIMGGDPDQVRKQGMDIFHSNVANSLIQNGRVIDADVYLKTNKDEMTKEGYEKSKLDLKPHLINSLATQKANSILLESKGNPFTENEKINAISDAEVRARTKELIDNAKKSKSDQEESILNEVTQAAIANGGVIPPEYNSKLSYAQALKVQDGVAEWMSKQLANQNKVDQLSLNERDLRIQSFHMKSTASLAKLTESDVLNFMKEVGANNKEQDEIRDTWQKAVKEEKSGGSAGSKTKQLIESTDSDIKNSIHRVLGEFGYEEGTSEHDTKFYSILEAINNNPEIKTHEQALKAARVQILAPFETYNNIPKENHEITDTDRNEGLHFIDGAKSGDNIANNEWVKESWPERWGEIPSDLTHNSHGVEVSKNFGLVYDFIVGRVYNLTPEAPKNIPVALKGKDVEWMVRPDYPGKGGYYCKSEDKWYDLNGNKLRMESAKPISSTSPKEIDNAMTTIHYSSFGVF